jgi:hypothetical protein
MKENNSICNRVITFPQFTGTCWFNALLMIVLYSENSRKLLLHKSKTWDTRIQILDTLKYILKHKYMRTSNTYTDYKILNIFSPEYILQELYKHNKKNFIFNPQKEEGSFAEYYIKKLYNFLGVSSLLYLDYNDTTDKLYYSIYNDIPKNNKFVFINEINFKKKMKSLENPEIIIINLSDIYRKKYFAYKFPYPSYYEFTDDKYTPLKSLEEKIIYNNEVYILDSVSLVNYNYANELIGGHQICGITCNGEKYIYNGWNKDIDISKINIPVPCELMKFKWNIKNTNKDFCLNQKTCFPDVIKKKSVLNIKKQNQLCFCFGNGQRVVIYIKKNKNTNIVKECPEGKVLNPVTNRCNNIKALNQKLAVVKECPEGKVLNPITNRCNNIKK